MLETARGLFYFKQLCWYLCAPLLHHDPATTPISHVIKGTTSEMRKWLTRRVPRWACHRTLCLTTSRPWNHRLDSSTKSGVWCCGIVILQLSIFLSFYISFNVHGSLSNSKYPRCVSFICQPCIYSYLGGQIVRRWKACLSWWERHLPRERYGAWADCLRSYLIEC
jgi:hypothetical protein